MSESPEEPECLVSVEHEGFALWEESLSVCRSPVAIILRPGRCIRFRLVDDRGLPCKDARVQRTPSGKQHFRFSDTGAFRVSIPEGETAIEIDVPYMAHPTIHRQLDWPARGDLDLGEMIISEKY